MTFRELVEAIQKICPNAYFDEYADGEIHIDTKLKAVSKKSKEGYWDQELVSISDEEEE